MAEASCGCGGNAPARKVLIYACSGGANVAEMADRAARQLMAEGRGGMFCLAGLGAEVPSMIQQAREADLNLVIDGCPVDCARRIFERLQITNVRIVRVTDLGIQKQKGVAVEEGQLRKVVAECHKALTSA